MKKGSSFAFVKFDNTESPRKATDAENDRVHGGCGIRVQIRDLNPPGRLAWKRGVQRHLAGSENHEGFAMSGLGYALPVEPVNPSYPYSTALKTNLGLRRPRLPSQRLPNRPRQARHHLFPTLTMLTTRHSLGVSKLPLPNALLPRVSNVWTRAAVYNPYAVVQPPAPTDPTAAQSQSHVPHTPIKPVYNATEHGSYCSDFQSDGPEARNTATPLLAILPPWHRRYRPPPASRPPFVAGHSYPPYNPVQWTSAGPTTPHIHTPGAYTHFPVQAQMTPGRHAPTFLRADSVPTIIDNVTYIAVGAISVTSSATPTVPMRAFCLSKRPSTMHE